MHSFEAMGLRMVHSALYHHGHDAKMLFFKSLLPKKDGNQVDSGNPVTHAEKELLFNLLREQNPDILGFRVFSNDFLLVKELIAEIRLFYKGLVMMGGPHPLVLPEECMQHCDIVCRGEGEKSMLELASCLSEGRDYSKIKNLWINKGPQTIKNELRTRQSDLDVFPIPIFKDSCSIIIENGKLEKREPYFDNTRYGIMAIRGCPYQCSYCSNSVFSEIYQHEPKSNTLRGRSVEHVMEELIYVKNTLPNIKVINFYDEVFAPSEKWVDEFCEKYISQINLPFYCEFFPGVEKESRLIKLKKAGLAGVWLGVQSGSELTRRNVFFRKPSNQIILNSAQTFAKCGISVKYDFILENPFEKVEDKIETAELMLRLPAPYSVNFFKLLYFPGTRLTQRALQEKIITSDQIEGGNAKTFYGIDYNDFNKPKEDVFFNHLLALISIHAGRGFIPMEKMRTLMERYLKDGDYSEIVNEYSVLIKK